MTHAIACTCDHCQPKDYYPAFEELVRTLPLDGIASGLEFFMVLERNLKDCMAAMKLQNPTHMVELFKEFSLVSSVSSRNGDTRRFPVYEVIIEKTNPEKRCFAYSVNLFMNEGDLVLDYMIDEMPGPECNNNLASGRLEPLKSIGEVLNAVDQVAAILLANGKLT